MNSKVITLLSLVGLLIACTPSAKVEKSWSDPSVASGGVNPFKKVLVVASIKDEATKRITEDKIAAQIKKSTVVKSYEYMKPTDTDDKMFEERLRKDGFDGILVMRLANVENSTSYVPGASYGGWYGYRFSDPGYYTENKTYFVETSAYSLESNKLIWSIATSTYNPSNPGKTIDGVILTVKNELQKKGLIPKQ